MTVQSRRTPMGKIVARKVLEELTHIWIHSPTRLIELVFSGFTGGWGGWVLAHPGCLSASPSFRLLLAHVPEHGVAMAALVIAVFRVIGATFRIQKVRVGAAMGGTFLWSSMTVSTYLSAPTSAGNPVFAWYSLVCFFLTIRLGWGRGAGES